MEPAFKREDLGHAHIPHTDHGSAILAEGAHTDSRRALRQRGAVEDRNALASGPRLCAIHRRDLEPLREMVDTVAAQLPIPRIVDREVIVIRAADDASCSLKPAMVLRHPKRSKAVPPLRIAFSDSNFVAVVDVGTRRGIVDYFVGDGS